VTLVILTASGKKKNLNPHGDLSTKMDKFSITHMLVEMLLMRMSLKNSMISFLNTINV